jgi:hypothetical protein
MLCKIINNTHSSGLMAAATAPTAKYLHSKEGLNHGGIIEIIPP